MRYVIHHHICEDEHYDLMIEDNDSLKTWRIGQKDLSILIDGHEIRGQKIKDHRKEYLSFEGQINSGKGRVEIFDSGKLVFIDNDINKIRCKFHGKIFRGEITISEQQEFTSIAYSKNNKA